MNSLRLEYYYKLLYDLKLNIEKIFEVKVRNWKGYEETTAIATVYPTGTGTLNSTNTS